MEMFEGCEGNARTWVLEERECPKCKAAMEVYTLRGRIVEDAVCPKCGYVLKAQEQVIPGIKKEKE